ncbi:MAG TPA: cyclic-di-AMP receptor [Leptolinea sp.]
MRKTPSVKNNLSQMLIAVIQAQDIDAALGALKVINIHATRLPSVGGFLGRRNATLLLDLKAEEIEKAQNALKESCRQRIEYLAVPLESAPLPLPTPTPINVGGATIFTVDIERFEEF